MMRRLGDILLSLVLIAVSLPFQIIFIILLLILSPGNPFFVQERIGRGGQAFKLIKLRTMKPTKSVQSGITVRGNDRVTGIGKFLRFFKLDELPQLFNILAGSMTFVGPRPEIAKYVELYSEEQRGILDYKPGLTDPASLKYRNEEEILAQFDDPVQGYIDNILPDKINISLEYQRKRGFCSDLLIILKTIAAVFQKR